MRCLLKGKLKLLRGQKGVSLIETLIAVAILGLIGAAFLSAVATGSKATGTLDEHVQAESLARSQLEDIKNALYDHTEPIEYPITVTLPPGYLLDITAEAKDADNTIQEITVTVSRDNGKPVLQMTDFKVDR